MHVHVGALLGSDPDCGPPVGDPCYTLQPELSLESTVVLSGNGLVDGGLSYLFACYQSLAGPTLCDVCHFSRETRSRPHHGEHVDAVR